MARSFKPLLFVCCCLFFCSIYFIKNIFFWRINSLFRRQKSAGQQQLLQTQGLCHSGTLSSIFLMHVQICDVMPIRYDSTVTNPFQINVITMQQRHVYLETLYCIVITPAFVKLTIFVVTVSKRLMCCSNRVS